MLEKHQPSVDVTTHGAGACARTFSSSMSTAMGYSSSCEFGASMVYQREWYARRKERVSGRVDTRERGDVCRGAVRRAETG